MRERQHRRTLHRRAVVGLTAAALVAAVHSDSTGQVAPVATGVPESSPVTAMDDASTGWTLAVTGGEGSAFAAPPTAAEPESVPAAQTGAAEASALASSGIPTTALEAYQRAAAGSPAACHITWPLIAAIGRVESDHGRFAGSVLRTDGRSTPPIIGIALDGTRSALIRDTDGGRLDGDPVYDRAVGPTQFIPSTWKTYASDGDSDGISDPLDIDDAAAATAKYLCAAGGDLSSVAGQTRAVFAYNHSASYVSTVLTLAATYAGTPPPVISTPSPEDLPAMPPANPAPPPAIEETLPTAAGPAVVEQPPAATPSSAPTTAPGTTTPPP
ncbi:MAG TPA: lytic transglycosylase domain-containing protein, partial [Blastococcus sp.]|nr:lytic transglycosylase domain-containing protein [Blastococcus sp.]